jgi:hypothetical protein
MMKILFKASSEVLFRGLFNDTSLLYGATIDELQKTWKERP